MTQDPGQPETTQPPQTTPGMPSPGLTPPTPPGTGPAYPAAYPPLPARRSHKAVFVVLGAVGLVSVIVLGALVIVGLGSTPVATPVATPLPTTRAYAGTFSQTGSMSFDREYHTATLLSDGRVLIAGGIAGRYYLASADLYS